MDDNAQSLISYSLGSANGSVRNQNIGRRFGKCCHAVIELRVAGSLRLRSFSPRGTMHQTTKKWERLAEHLEWAERHGRIVAVAEFLRNLSETDWHHVDD